MQGLAPHVWGRGCHQAQKRGPRRTELRGLISPFSFQTPGMLAAGSSGPQLTALLWGRRHGLPAAVSEEATYSAVRAG